MHLYSHIVNADFVKLNYFFRLVNLCDYLMFRCMKILTPILRSNMHVWIIFVFILFYHPGLYIEITKENIIIFYNS